MKKLKVLYDFLKLTVAEKIITYRIILANLRSYPNKFPNPYVPLNNVDTLIGELESANQTAQNGGHPAYVNLQNAEVAADKAFRELANYVSYIANGDEATILLAGFTPTNEPAQFQKPDLAVSNGSKSGAVKLVAKAIDGAGAYIYQSAKDAIPTDDSGWTNAGHTTLSYIEIPGFDIESKYYFRVAGIIATGITKFTQPVKIIVE